MNNFDSKISSVKKNDIDPRDEAPYTSIGSNSIVRDTTYLTVKDILHNESKYEFKHPEQIEPFSGLETKSKSQKSVQKLTEPKSKPNYDNDYDDSLLTYENKKGFSSQYDKLGFIDIPFAKNLNSTKNSNSTIQDSKAKKSQVTSPNNPKIINRIEAPSTNINKKSPKRIADLYAKYDLDIQMKNLEKNEKKSIMTEQRLDMLNKKLENLSDVSLMNKGNLEIGKSTQYQDNTVVSPKSNVEFFGKASSRKDNPISNQSPKKTSKPNANDASTALSINQARANYTIPDDIKVYDNNNNKCRDHPIEDIQYFCFTNEKCLCVECMLNNNHYHHDVQNIRRAREKIQKKVDKLVLDIKGKAEDLAIKEKTLMHKKEDFEEVINEAKNIIQKHFDELRKLIDKKEQELATSLSEALNEKFTEMDYISNLMNKKIELITQLQNIINENCQNLNDACFCDYFSTKMIKIYGIITADDPFEFNGVIKIDKIKSIIDNETLKKMINDIEFIKFELDKTHTPSIPYFLTARQILSSTSNKSFHETRIISDREKVRENGNMRRCRDLIEDKDSLGIEGQRMIDFNKKYQELAESLQINDERGSQGGYKDTSSGEKESFSNTNNKPNISQRELDQSRREKEHAQSIKSVDYALNSSYSNTNSLIPKSTNSNSRINNITPSKSVEALLEKFRKMGLGTNLPTKNLSTAQIDTKFIEGNENDKLASSLEDSEKSTRKLLAQNPPNLSLDKNLIKTSPRVIFPISNSIMSSVKKPKGNEVNNIAANNSTPNLIKNSYHIMSSTTNSNNLNSVSCLVEKIAGSAKKDLTMNTTNNNETQNNNPVLNLLTKQKEIFYNRSNYKS